MTSGSLRARVATVVTLLVLLLGLAGSTTAAFGQASPCPPGQPQGRPPGQPPTQPGPPNGRPPNYPPGRCNLQLSKGSVERGESVQVTGNGFVPGSQVTLTLASGRHLGFATAGADGGFTTSVVVPMDAELGRTEVVASDGVTTLSASLEIVDRAAATAAAGDPPSRSAGRLSRTGTDVLLTVAGGAALIVVGSAAVLAARRRRVAL